MGNHAARTPLIVNSARSFRLVPESTRSAPIMPIIGGHLSIIANDACSTGTVPLPALTTNSPWCAGRSRSPAVRQPLPRRRARLAHVDPQNARIRERGPDERGAQGTRKGKVSHIGTPTAHQLRVLDPAHSSTENRSRHQPSLSPKPQLTQLVSAPYLALLLGD